MYDTEEKLRALLGIEAESVSLDFKDGAALNNMNDGAKKSLVVDVTAMANSGGGTIIYGITEAAQQDGRSVAGAFAPVTDERITQDRVREIVYSNTDPALSGFTVTCVPVEGGRVIVVNVAEGDTAYQNKMDRRYYNRVDASSAPMYGFAVRDVMNRRTKPQLRPALAIHHVDMEQQRHRYVVTPSLENTGNLTASHWTLSVGLPWQLGFIEANYALQVRYFHPYGDYERDYRWFEFSSERPPGGGGRILPGQTRHLGQDAGYGLLEIRITDTQGQALLRNQPPLRWVLYLDDSPRTAGTVPYDQWSRW